MNKLFLYILFIPNCFFGQLYNSSSHIYNWFDNIIGYETLSLHNGRQYVDDFSGKVIDDSHVFFSSDKVLEGTITYNGSTFYNLYFKYDVFNDEIILQSEKNKKVILLVKDKVKEFILNKSHFTKLDAKTAEGEKIQGFYELLYKDSGIILYKKHKKYKRDIISGDRIQYKFISKNTYFLLKGEYFEINNKSQLLKIFSEDKNYIKHFYKENNHLKKS